MSDKSDNPSCVQVGALALAGAEPKAVLAACDQVRDGALVDLGVRLEDKADGGLKCAALG